MLPSPTDTSFTDLARRIHRSIMVFERYKREPGRREAYYLLLAIRCLDEGRVDDGHQAMRAAENIQVIPATDAAASKFYDEVTAADLRAALRKVVRRED